MRWTRLEELHTRISYTDDKWIYIEQKITRQGKDIAAAFVKSTVRTGARW